MKLSEYFLYTLREDPKEAESISHKLSLKAGLLNSLASGIFSYLPLGLRVLKNIENIVRSYMDTFGAQELLMPGLQPIELWKKTGRDELLGEVMFKFDDRRQRKLCLGPTHEEIVTDLVRKYITSYKQLPVILYQIQTKFRDEIRPRFGLVRSCEFIMKDAYSFDKDEQGLDENYKKMREAYDNIFKACDLDVIVLKADSGMMGGSDSEEFLVEADSGEDILKFCKECNRYYKDKENCPECKGVLEEKKALEIGHIFKLGTKYSGVQGAGFIDSQGVKRDIIMGCYGIGVSRLLPAIIESNYDQEGIIWPKKVAPFDLELVILGDDAQLKETAFNIYDKLTSQGREVLIDDRNESAGVKFNDAYLLGMPYLFIMGKKNFLDNKIEVVYRKNKYKELIDIDKINEWVADNIDL